MLSVEAIYDGKKLIMKDNLSFSEPKKVIVTFIDEPENEFPPELLSKMAETGGSFDFLNNPDNDIYSDKDLKVKY